MSRYATPVLDEVEQRLGKQLREALERAAGDLAVITFRENARGGDPVGMSPDGVAVFPDKYSGGDDIEPGQTWLCALKRKSGTTCFGAPIMQLGARYYIDLLPGQIHRFVEAAFDDGHGQEVIDLLRRAATEEEDAAVLAAIVERGSKSQGNATEHLESRIEALQAELVQAQRDLNAAYDDNEALREQLVSRPVVEPAVASNGDTPDHGITHSDLAGLRGPDRRAVAVELDDEGRLSSEAFIANAYHGHISPGRTMLFLKPHAHGDMLCTDGRIAVAGLDRFVVNLTPRQLRGHFEKNHAGFVVDLR